MSARDSCCTRLLLLLLVLRQLVLPTSQQLLLLLLLLASRYRPSMGSFNSQRALQVVGQVDVSWAIAQCSITHTILLAKRG
jgi:hypothetical protein